VSVDFFAVDDLLTADERAVRDRVRRFVEAEVRPVANDYWQRGEPPIPLLPRLAALGVVGGAVAGYGGPALSAASAGLVHQELARGDGSLATIVAVHVAAMATIHQFGSEAQRQRWLPPMARFEATGAWALTEPDAGSDARAIATRARRDGDVWVLDGRKRWAGNATFADLVIVWAIVDGEGIGAFLVERSAPGLVARAIEGKALLRAAPQADVELDACRVPAASRLAGASGFDDASGILVVARLGAAWGALGHAIACYELALAYVAERRQFGRPLAGFQLVQDKLARMLADLTAMQLLVWRAARLADQGRLTRAMTSLVKMNNAASARRIAADARDMLGGNGILLERHVVRHMLDLEALYTYEGTDSVSALIVGREITGLSAFR
jgi:glutaryl-CoA dehydrogenase